MDVYKRCVSFYLSTLLILSFASSLQASLTAQKNSLTLEERDIKHAKWLVGILFQRSDPTCNKQRDELIETCVTFEKHTRRDLELYTIEMLNDTIRAEENHLKAIALFEKMFGQKPSAFLSTATILRDVDWAQLTIRELRK